MARGCNTQISNIVHLYRERTAWYAMLSFVYIRTTSTLIANVMMVRTAHNQIQ